jgi:hypothetical protein
VANADPEPKVRHEFVGMMFAITIGEVGLQVASLVQAKHYAHFLPFYFRLFLATIVITSSWVGWTLSQAPGARRDVKGVFTWEFVTLLLDVFLVITYFIIVRTIEVGKGKEAARIDPPGAVALLLVVMFVLYLVWDLITKVAVYRKINDGNWLKNCGARMVPTLVCVTAALYLRSKLTGIETVHFIDADVALTSLALLFRGLKDVVSATFPRSGGSAEWVKIRRALVWSSICAIGMILGTRSATHSWNILPAEVAREIRAPVLQESSSEKPKVRVGDSSTSIR